MRLKKDKLPEISSWTLGKMELKTFGIGHYSYQSLWNSSQYIKAQNKHQTSQKAIGLVESSKVKTSTKVIQEIFAIPCKKSELRLQWQTHSIYQWRFLYNNEAAMTNTFQISIKIFVQLIDLISQILNYVRKLYSLL